MLFVIFAGMVVVSSAAFLKGAFPFSCAVWGQGN